MHTHESTTGAERLSPRQRRWLIVGGVVAAAVTFALFLAEPARSLNEAACDGDGPDGYECTELLNKGGGEVIGEQFYRRLDGDLEIITHLFDAPSTGHVEEKLCLDDDEDPLADNVSCTGATAGTKVNAGDPLPDPDAGEERAGLYEVAVQNIEEAGVVTIDGEDLARYVVAVDGYEFASFHFNQGDFSVESFFAAPLPPNLAVTKTPDGATINPGDTASFTVEVHNAGPGTATGVTLDDSLPAGLDWTDDSDACAITDGTLTCDFGDLEAGATATVTVSAVTTADHCGTLDNTATAQAANHDPVSDPGSITVQCGAISVTKTAKHADDSGATAPNLSAGFTITDSSGATVATVTTDEAGQGCAGGLAFGDYTVTETGVPAGYAAPAPQQVTVDTAGACDGATESVTFDNVPLTDITVTATPQVDGATASVVNCWEGAVSGDPDYTGDDSLDVTGLAPTDPDVTLTCEIIVDP